MEQFISARKDLLAMLSPHLSPLCVQAGETYPPPREGMAREGCRSRPSKICSHALHSLAMIVRLVIRSLVHLSRERFVSLASPTAGRHRTSRPLVSRTPFLSMSSVWGPSIYPASSTSVLHVPRY